MATSNLERKFLFFHTNPYGTYSFMGMKFKKKPYFFFGKRATIGLLLILPLRFIDTVEEAQPVIETIGKLGYNLLMGGLLLIFVVLAILDWKDYQKIP